MSTKNFVEFDQSKCVDKKWGHQHVSKYLSIIIDYFIYQLLLKVSSFATYPIESVREEVQKSPIKPPTITPKYDSNAMSTVLEWHVSLLLRNEIH
jgi:hypothetical protein